jgi:DNA polymerase-3 subunit gamma/tau
MQKRYEFESGKFADADLLKNLSVLSDAADKMSRSLDREVTIELAVLSLVEKMGRQVTREPAVREPIIDKTAPPLQNPADNTKDLPEPVWRPDPMPEEAIDEKPPVSDPDLPDQMAFDLPAPENSGSDLLPDWGEIIALVRKKNGMLGSVLSKSKAHFDGKRVLIEASEVAMKFIRENQESNQTLKEAIAEVTGKYYPIGPWKKKEQPAVDTNDGLQKFLKAAESAGVDIVRR